MLSTMALPQQKELQQASAANKCALKDLLECLEGYGERGEKRIALFVKEVRGDGKGDTSGV